MSQRHIIRACLGTPAPEGHTGLPLLLWGPPGSGKTFTIKQEAARLAGLPYMRLSPAERGEGAFGCVPVPATDGYLSYPPPRWVKQFEDTGGGIVFLDEISTAPPALQSPLLGLVQIRVIGDYTFPVRTRIIAAANEVIDAAGGWNLAPALCNRFGHLAWTGLTPTQWADALLTGFAPEGDDATPVDAAVEEERVAIAWPAALAAARSLVSGFIRRNPTLLRSEPPKGRGMAKAWSSDRTCNYAVHCIAGAMVHGLSAIDADEMLAAFVGRAWASTFASWRVNADLPDPADVLDGRVTWAHDPARPDRTLVALGAMTSFLSDPKVPDRIRRAGKAWQIVGACFEAAGEAAIPAIRTLINSLLVAPMVPEAKAVMGRAQKVIAASGIRSRA